MRNHTKPTAYAIHYPNKGLLKVGTSVNMRWRTWKARGAEVVALVEFDDASEARIFESRTLAHLRSLVPSAFQSNEEAIAELGVRAGGWTEFFRLPQGTNPADLLEKLPRLNDGKKLPAMPLPMARTERTYERTNERFQDSSKNTLVPDAAKGVDKR